MRKDDRSARITPSPSPSGRFGRRAPRYTIVKAKMERGGRVRERMGGFYAALRARSPDANAATQAGLRLAGPVRGLLVRPSGPEPIIRLIPEAPTGAAAQRLIE